MAVNTAETSGRRLSKQDRRAQLLAVGARLFDEHTYDEVNMSDVARTAGISHGLVYHYFRSKEAFFLAALEAAAEEMLVGADAAPELSAPEAAEYGIRSFIDQVSSHACLFVSAHRGTASELPEVRKTVGRMREAFADRALAPLRPLARPLPNTQFALAAYFGLCERALLDWLEAPEPIDRAGLERLLFASFGAAVATGLELDLPDQQAERSAWLAAFRNHFALP